MTAKLSILVGIAITACGVAAAAESWEARLSPTERTCLDRIRKSEGAISGLRTTKTVNRPGGFDLLLEVERAGGTINIRCQGARRDGADEVTDVTRE